MSDTKKPNELTKEDEGSIASRDRPTEDRDKTESGTGTSVKVPDSPATNGEADKKTKDFHERLRTLLTALALTVAIWAAFVSSDSRNAAKRSAGAAEDSARATQRSAAAAEKSAEAAQTNAKIAEKSLILTVRPGVTIFISKLSDFVVGKDVRVDFSIKNAGPGMAKGLSIGGELVLCPNHTIPCLEACTKTLVSIPSFPMELQPGAGWEGALVQGPISEDQWNQFSSGNYTVQFCGHITCSTALLNPEEFPFCYVYERVEGRWLHCPGRMNQNK